MILLLELNMVHIYSFVVTESTHKSMGTEEILA